jgi:glycosyltransferase involved in cell wall biosynthesis
MKVVMLGWELPPIVSGGLGMACDGLLTGLGQEGVDVTFVVPWWVRGLERDSATVVGAFGSVHPGGMPLHARIGAVPSYTTRYGGTLYSVNVLEEVDRFAEAASRSVEGRDFDVVHAHDWMTFRAAMSMREALGVPMLGHFHSIEDDRAPGSPSPHVTALEKEGLAASDRIVAVSDYTRLRIAGSYGMDSRSVEVIHNGVDEFVHLSPRLGLSDRWPRTVLFVGRLTAQKGPQYFLLAAEKVLRSAPETRFILAGEGDMRERLQAQAEDMDIADKVLFTGFLSRFDLDRVYNLASVCVMTSVSEPFGLVALEAMKRGIPVIVPDHAGVTEVVRNCRRVDQRDVDAIAREILEVLDFDRQTAEELAENAAREVGELTWRQAARKLIGIYEQLSVAGQR